MCDECVGIYRVSLLKQYIYIRTSNSACLSMFINMYGSNDVSDDKDEFDAVG